MVDLLHRHQWGATAPLGPLMRLPVGGVHVHHSVTNPDNDSVYEATGDVAADMREIERIGVQRFGRFSYSYCGHPSGWVGCGAELTIGAHTAGWNSSSLGFCLIGNYDVAWLTDAQVRAFLEWRGLMVSLGALTPDHWVEPHNARKATACPGRNTMARWPELTGPYTNLPQPQPEPVQEDDDMPLIVTNAAIDRGIWVQVGPYFWHAHDTDTVSALKAAGAKEVAFSDSDFIELEERAAAMSAAELVGLNLQLTAIRTQIDQLIAGQNGGTS